MRQLFIIFSLLCFSIRAQDSISKAGLKIFDCVAFIGPVNYIQPSVTMDYISKFTSRDLSSEVAGYSIVNDRFYSSTSGINLGLNLTFKIVNPKHSFLKRVKPRVAVHWTELDLLSAELTYSHNYTIDSLFFTNPKIKPILIDSSSNGRLNYSFISQLVFVEVGANVDVLNRRYFNIYAGVTVGQGFSVLNEFKTKKEESYSVSPYPDQKQGANGIFLSYENTEKDSRSYCTRVGLAIGVQHRFSNRRVRSLGFFAELKPGMEFYKVKNAGSLAQKALTVSLGARYSFCRHK